MATRFELVLYGENEPHMRSAGEEALQEIDRLDHQLSFYRNDSEITFLNRHAAEGFVKVEPRLFGLLKRCAALTALTDGAFDVTIAPLMRAWRFVRDTGGVPTGAERERAREAVGMGKVVFDEETFSVRFLQEGVEIDLGGFGKGYAVQRAVDWLRENGIESALLHGGTSSVATLGRPPDQDAWRIELPHAFQRGGEAKVVDLVDRCLSISAIHGKYFLAEGKRLGHIINPITGDPASANPAAAVTGADAAVCEALSKAALIHSANWLETLAERLPDYVCFIATPAEGQADESWRKFSPQIRATTEGRA
jgi:thiamine biosynthesis lipoprotein